MLTSLAMVNKKHFCDSSKIKLKYLNCIISKQYSGQKVFRFWNINRFQFFINSTWFGQIKQNYHPPIYSELPIDLTRRTFSGNVMSLLFILFYFSSTSLLLPTHLPPPSFTHAQSCNPMDCSPPDSSVRGFFQARILEWVAISFSNVSAF